jgi:nucleotide-binding universal stress UspA family protein
MTGRTVVGWDASPAGQSALEWAAQREAADGELLLVRVVESGGEMSDAQTELDASAAAVVAHHARVRVHTLVVQGDVVDRLHRFSDSTSLLVIGSGHSHQPGQVWSIGARLAGRLLGPLAVIPEDEESVRPRSAVVVGVDGSPLSFEASMFAALEADRRGEPLRIVHVWREPGIWQDAFSSDANHIDTLERQHGEILTEAADLVEREFPRLQVHQELVRAHPAPGLIASGQNALLLVVGSRGHRETRRMFLGSVSHFILMHGSGPTVIVSPLGTTSPGATGVPAAAASDLQ